MGLREWFRAWAAPQVYRYDTSESALHGLSEPQLTAIVDSPTLYDAQSRQAAELELQTRKQQVQGILVIVPRPLSNSQRLLQQIVDQQRGRGYSLASSLVAAVRVGDPNDKAYVYAPMRSVFAGVGGVDLMDRTRVLPFQASDGNDGKYFIVFARRQ
jgi:hypothetical protein